MATLKPIQFKRTKTANSKPTAAQLLEGELAINLKDRTIFTKDDAGNIIDLGFAKGGQVDGTINHTGNYNQTGNYAVTGTITSNGEIRSNAEMNSPTIISRNGAIRSRAPGTSHFWFEGTSTNEIANASGAEFLERGVIYSEVPSEKGASIRLRVMNGYNNKLPNGSRAQTLYTFGGDGTFDAHIVTTDLVDHYKKPIGQYDSSSLVVQDSAAPGGTVNLLRKYRGQTSGGIWHELVDYQTGRNAMGYYQGDKPNDHVMTLSSSGEMILNKSLAVGYNTTGKPVNSSYSVLPGDYSIALGDNDTGFSWNSDGIFDIFSNSTQVARIQTGSQFLSTKQLVASYRLASNINAEANPASNNHALLRVTTGNDDNANATAGGSSANGDGHTHIGYWSGNAYHHYLRGKGTTVIDTMGGLTVRFGTNFLSDVNMKTRVLTTGQVLLDHATYPNGTTRLANWHSAGSKTYRFEIYNTVGTGSTKNRINVMTTDIADVDLSANNYNQKTTFVGDLGWNGLTSSQIRMNANNTGSNVIRFAADNTYGNHALIFRRSEANFYMIPSLPGDVLSNDINQLRPFQLHIPTGGVAMSNGVTMNHTSHPSVESAIPLTINGGAAVGEGDIVVHSGASARGGVIINNTYGQDLVGGIIAESSNINGNFVVNHGNLAGNRFYPTVKGLSQNGGGYRMSFEMGILQPSTGGWGNGVLRIRGDNPNGQQSVFQFTMEGAVIVPGEVSAGGVITTGTGYGLRTDSIAKRNGTAFIAADGNINIPEGGSNGFSAGWLLGQINTRLNTAQSRADSAYNLANQKFNTSGGTISGNVQINGTLNTTGDIKTNVWVYAAEFNLTSDIFYKKDIIDIESQSAKLHDVKIRRYKMKDGNNDNAIGVIAQEFEKHYPELVTLNGEGKKAVNYRAMSTVLWKIVQEKDIELQDMKSRLERIEELLSK